MLKNLFLVTSFALSGLVFATPQSGGWLSSIYSGGSDIPSTPERPVIMLTHEDQTTECCDEINILPDSDLNFCVNSTSNGSLANIERQKV